MENTSRPSTIDIAEKVLIGIEKHAYSNLEAEVGGMLFGRIDDQGVAHVIGSIPALTAAAEQISLTFTHDVWADILAKGEKQYPGEKIVGWYHTHPSFGLFLSEYDEFIQRNFFGQPGQIALVLDPIAGEMGWFTKDGDDKINLIFKEATKVGPKSPIRPQSPLEANWKGRALTHGGAAVVSAFLTWGIIFSTSGPSLESSQQALFEEYNFIMSYVQQPNLTYVSSTGDTYRSISKMFYGDASQAESLRLDNGGGKLEIGSVLFVRGPVRFAIADPNFVPMPVLETPEESPEPTVEPTPTTEPTTPEPSLNPTPGGTPTSSDDSSRTEEPKP
jgi:proteasome lid subunit RPN8/RPN11